MKAAVLITRLYPPAVRARWGAEISHDVSRSGIRSWPDTIVGAVRLWLHPSDWPETLAGQTRRVLFVALFAVAAVTALLLRATQPSVVLTADVRHPVTSLWLAPIVLGIGLAVPRPPLRWDALRSLAAMAIRVLTAPALAVGSLVLAARSGVIDHPTGFADVALVVCYWAILGFTAARLCALIARVARTVTVPTTRRLRAGFLLIGTGLGLATGQYVLAIPRTPHAGSLIVTLALGLLAAATISAGHDLRGGRA